MFKFTVISILVLCVFYSSEIDAASVSLHSLYLSQKLQPKDGYVPVYIKFGDTPLFAINRDLAAAFQETESANNKIQSNKKDFEDGVNGNSESNENKERKENTIINSIQDDSKKNQKIKNVD